MATTQLEQDDHFFLVARAETWGTPFRDWLDGRLLSGGYSSDVVAQFGVIQVIEYTKT